MSYKPTITPQKRSRPPEENGLFTEKQQCMIYRAIREGLSGTIIASRFLFPGRDVKQVQNRVSYIKKTFPGILNHEPEDLCPEEDYVAALKPGFFMGTVMPMVGAPRALSTILPPGGRVVSTQAASAATLATTANQPFSVHQDDDDQLEEGVQELTHSHELEPFVLGLSFPFPWTYRQGDFGWIFFSGTAPGVELQFRMEGQKTLRVSVLTKMQEFHRELELEHNLQLPKSILSSKKIIVDLPLPWPVWGRMTQEQIKRTPHFISVKFDLAKKHEDNEGFF